MKNSHPSPSIIRFGLGLLSLLLASMAFSRPAAAQASDDEVKMYYSLYYEDFKNENCEGALPNLHWILENAPGYPRNDERNFERAIECYEKLAEAAEGDMMRTYLDSALIMYDNTMPILEDAGAEVDSIDWIFQKGRFIQKHTADLPELQGEVGDIYRRVYEADHTKLTGYYIEYIIRDYVSNNDKQGAVEFMDDAETKFGDNEEVITSLQTWRGQLFTSPEERYDFVVSQLEKDPENIELLQEQFELAQELEKRDELYGIGQKLVQMEPTPKTYGMMAEMHLADGEPEKALELFQKAIDMGATDAKTYYSMGTAEREMGRLSRARTHFRKALDVNPDYGMALIAIGDLYGNAVAECGTFEREDRTVYWLVADYYERAATRDPSLAEQARQRAQGIRRYFPSAEDKFFKGWNAGDSFTVNAANSGSCYGWINESTKVR
jgi:tetratricopeptide (TPR) repeat protein